MTICRSLFLSQIIDCCSFNWQSIFVTFDKGIKTFYICRIRIHFGSCVSCEYFIVQVIIQCFIFFFVDHVRSQKCDSPCTAFSGCLHNRYRYTYRTCHNLLSYTFCFKESAMSQDLIQFHACIFQKNIQTGL